jgi:putative transcriptional regulator
MTDKNYKSEAFEAIHSSARALYKIKAIDKETMRSFDDACLIKNEQTRKPLEN